MFTTQVKQQYRDILNYDFKFRHTLPYVGSFYLFSLGTVGDRTRVSCTHNTDSPAEFRFRF